jgi:hypothetical protein
MAIDITYTAGPNRDKKSLSIFQFDQKDFEALTICLAQPSKARPSDFSATRGSKRLLISLKYSATH